jgi:hypothetical protein
MEAMLAQAHAAHLHLRPRIRVSTQLAQWLLVSAIVVLATVLLIGFVPSMTSRNGALDGLQPQPLPAPGPIAAGFPEQSRIASCWVLGNVSSVLEAPRSEQSAAIVGPVYAEACLVG